MSEWKLIRYDADDQRIWRRPALRHDGGVSDLAIYIADHSGDRGADGDQDTAGNPDQTDDGPLRIDPTRMAKRDPCHPCRFTVPVIAEKWVRVDGRSRSPGDEADWYKIVNLWAGCSLKVFAELQELVPTLVATPDVDWDFIKKVMAINATRIDEFAGAGE